MAGRFTSRDVGVAALSALVVVGLIIVAASLVLDRYEFMQVKNVVFRADRLTGEVVLCGPQGPGPLRCTPNAGPRMNVISRPD